jgi:hypothetical protein
VISFQRDAASNFRDEGKKIAANASDPDKQAIVCPTTPVESLRREALQEHLMSVLPIYFRGDVAKDAPIVEPTANVMPPVQNE